MPSEVVAAVVAVADSAAKESITWAQAIAKDKATKFSTQSQNRFSAAVCRLLPPWRWSEENVVVGGRLMDV